ncbi:MAG: LysR family transcriptional regulator [Alphaproteobacteria bacterium]|nr:LysR family transcriptional regulator [Alphaproteobacteria bacterium]
MSQFDNIRTFVRVFELGSMSEAARDQRVSPAVASSRISRLEKHLGVRLFNRTTRRIHPTEHGQAYYEGAVKVLQAMEEAEAAVAAISRQPRGTIFVAAPLGVGRRFIAPNVPAFKDSYPEINVRLRMSDRNVDITKEGIDVAFHLGSLTDSSLRLNKIADCPRVLCAAPDYIARRGMPADGQALIDDRHDCLLLRFPGAPEFAWTLIEDGAPRSFEVDGPFESDDGDVLTDWALAGQGIANKPVFEVADHLKSGALVPVATATPPTPAQLSCLYPHKQLQDPKITLFMDFMVARCREELKGGTARVQLPR